MEDEPGLPLRRCPEPGEWLAVPRKDVTVTRHRSDKDGDKEEVEEEKQEGGLIVNLFVQVSALLSSTVLVMPAGY